MPVSSKLVSIAAYRTHIIAAGGLGLESGVHLSNEAIWILFLVADMCAVVGMYRWFGKEGLYAYMVLALIACNIEVLKQVDLFGLQVTLGNILYGSLFLTSDILVEMHGKQEARKAVWTSFFALLLMTGFLQLSILMAPSATDAAQPHLVALFSFLPRIAIASLTAYILSQLTDVALFHLIKVKTAGRKLWLRSNASILLSQALDTAVFTLLAFAPLPVIGAVPGFESWATVWAVGWTAYVLKLIVSVADTPFVYWARAVGRRRYGHADGVIQKRPAGEALEGAA